MEITNEDFLTVIGQFSDAVHKSFDQQPECAKEVNAIIREFEQHLKETLKIIPGIKEDEQCQKIKSGIEELEKQGREIKLELGACRNQFRTKVTEATQQTLNENRPDFDLPELPTSPPPLPEEYVTNLKSLTILENSLIKELQDLTISLPSQQKKLEDLANKAEGFLQIRKQ